MNTNTTTVAQHDLRTCQTFKQGCVGCCVNMRWPDAKVWAFLQANTAAAQRLWPKNEPPTLVKLIRCHWARTGMWDHLLACWLVPLTFGLSAWLWKVVLGSCPFAGILDPTTGRAGCLVHPLRIGGCGDARRHAFPLVPTLGCNRRLRCALLDDPTADEQAGLLTVSRQGWMALRKKISTTKPDHSVEGSKKV